MELAITPFTIILIGIIVIILTWVGILTYQLQGMRSHYNKLTRKTKKGELQAALNEILRAQHRQYETIAEIQQQIRKIKKDTSFHLQLIGFKRFNPFSDTGGEQSFVLAILDKHKSGVVVSSLHNRDITRLYTKEVVKGKTKDVTFSEEEKEVVAKAKVIRA